MSMMAASYFWWKFSRETQNLATMSMRALVSSAVARLLITSGVGPNSAPSASNTRFTTVIRSSKLPPRAMATRS